MIIERKIFLVRGHKVVFDSDLANLYEVETRALLQAVKRNMQVCNVISSFPS